MAYLDFSNKRYSKDQLADLRAMMVKLNSSTLVPEEAGSVTLDEFKEWLEETVQDYVDDNQEDLRGPAGATGPQGSTGVGISSIENYYAVTSTNTSPTLSEITSSTIPALNSTNKYLWRKEVVNFTNGTSTASIALICVQGDTGSKGDTGNTGPQGPQGPAGSNGTNGVSAYVHIKYAGSVDETTGIPEDEDLTDSPSIYMGVYTGSSPLASDTASDYTWMLIGANVAAAYSKDEVDDLLDLKATQSDMDRVADYLGVDVTKKRNLWDEMWENGYFDENGVEQSNSNFIRSANFIKVKPSTTYAKVVPYYIGSYGLRVVEYNTSMVKTVASGTYNATFTTKADTAYVKFSTATNYYGGSYKNDIAIIEGTSGEYVPYVEQLANVRPHSNRNLLDNPFFSVNQRGATSYSGSDSASVYTVDRWFMPQYASGDVITVTSTGITWKANANGRYLRQMLDSYVLADCGGKKVTISILFSDGTMKSVSLVCPTSGNRVNDDYAFGNIGFYLANSYSGQSYIFLRSVSAFTVGIRAVKLELGSSSTLANDAPPNYAEELMKCQRYYLRLNATVSLGTFVNASNISSSHRIFGTVQYPVPMRAKPSFTNSSDVKALQGTSSIGSLASPTFSLSGNNQIGEVTITSTSLTTVGIYYIWKDSGYWEFSADL